MRQFTKSTNVPSPVKTRMPLDEHADSINDGFFINNKDAGNWQDIVGSYHDGACGVAFAGGHPEVHKCQSKTKVTFNNAPPAFAKVGKEVDLRW